MITAIGTARPLDRILPADYGRAASQADRAGDRTQIIPFGAVVALSRDRPLSASGTDRQPGDAQVMLRR
jgi:hypothetical protein